MTQLTNEYFQNKKQQAVIKGKLLEAIPANVYYHNLIIALAELLADMTRLAWRDDVYTKAMKDKMDAPAPQEPR